MGAVAPPRAIPKRGKSTRGRSAVAKSGIASVIHQVAMRRATAAMRVTAGFPRLEVEQGRHEEQSRTKDQADLLHRARLSGRGRSRHVIVHSGNMALLRWGGHPRLHE